MVLVVVGNFAEKDMLLKIREYFGTENKGESMIFEKSPVRLSKEKI
jgi:predicted Zn-dependent peptidase